MIGRRGLLGMLAGAPIAGRAVAEEVMSRGIGSSVAGGVAGSWRGEACDTMQPEDPAVAALRRKFWRKREKGDARLRALSPQVRAMKSWSEVFKHHVEMEDALDRNDKWRDAEEILNSDTSALEKTMRLAAMGIHL